MTQCAPIRRNAIPWFYREFATRITLKVRSLTWPREAKKGGSIATAEENSDEGTKLLRWFQPENAGSESSSAPPASSYLPDMTDFFAAILSPPSSRSRITLGARLSQSRPEPNLSPVDCFVFQ